MKVVIKVFPTPTMLGEACRTWMAFAIMADAAKVPPSRIGEEDVRTEVDGLSRPIRRRPARASSDRSVVLSIATRISTSFGIALAVTSEPKSEIRCTPGQARAARTNECTARSSARRGSATEGEGPRGRLARILLHAGSLTCSAIFRTMAICPLPRHALQQEALAAASMRDASVNASCGARP
jgi:hypothetical protein